MGINGILKEIKPTRRVAFTKLAIDHFLQNSRPLRVAIDISIWNYEVRNARGGTNPELRTLYLRFLNLLKIPIHPLFVFDGPDKPPFKRNKATISFSEYDVNSPTKQLLDLLGFPWHVAPGEAEAECALFQKHDVVDAVLSEDSDTLMFGSRRTFLNYSTEESKGKAPKSHVDEYEQQDTKERFELDPQGMMLVALMSGGDYLPAGIPRCGPVVAIEAAKAGFGQNLCKLSSTDVEGIAEWKAKLRHEFDTNESGFFTTKHPGLQMPETFPDMKVLRCYTNPKVSSPSEVEALKDTFVWDRDIDVHGLRAFCARAFEWRYKSGARYLMKGLAGPLLINALRRRGETAPLYDTLGSTLSQKLAQGEALVKGPDKGRAAFENDGVKELRVYYVPADVVDINLDAEEDNPITSEGLGEWEEREDLEEDQHDQISSSPKKPRKFTPFYPTQPRELWVFEAILKAGVPNIVQRYEQEGKLQPSKPVGAKRGASRKLPAPRNPQEDAMLRFVKVTKADITMDQTSQKQDGTTNITLPSTPIKSKPAKHAPLAVRKTPSKTKKQVLGKNQAQLMTFIQTPNGPSGPNVKRRLSPPARDPKHQPQKMFGSSQDPIHLLSSSPEPPDIPPSQTTDRQIIFESALPSPLTQTNRRREGVTAPLRIPSPVQERFSSSPLPDLHDILGFSRRAPSNA